MLRRSRRPSPNPNPNPNRHPNPTLTRTQTKVEEAKGAVAREVSARASAPAKIILCYAELGDIDEVMHLHPYPSPHPRVSPWLGLG